MVFSFYILGISLTGHQELMPDNDTKQEKIEDTDHNDNSRSEKKKKKKKDHNANYKDFFNDVENGKWSSAMDFLVQSPGAIRANIPNLGCTALHQAVETEQEDVVKKLVELMEEEDLEIIDDDGDTALIYAVDVDNVEMAKCMVEKNKKILSIGSPPDGWLPVLIAYSRDQWDMALYLYHHTPLEALKSRSGAELISQSFTKENVVIPWDLIHRCPSLVVATDYFGHSPLNALAGMRCAFLSGKQLKFWEQWIYDVIHIEPTINPRPISDNISINVQTEENNEDNQRNISRTEPTLIPPPVIDDIRINVPRAENNEDNQRNTNRTNILCINRTGMGSLRQLTASLRKLLDSRPYNRIYKMKLIHEQSLAFLRFMCEVAKNENLNDMQLRFVQSAIFKAVERGHIEFITHILGADPGCAEMTDAQGMNMFHFAVECRQEKVYSLIYGLNPRDRKDLIEGPIDDLNNGLLHIVGRLTPYAQLDHIQDAALRMQRELQWFKEVEDIAPQMDGELMTITDNMTPRELFKKNHKELKKEGEKSMKGTATSCTVVGALIVTIMFAAAFTVPGGNKGETGIPVLIHRKWFMVFIVADVISLCLSTTSVIIFLGILTSRYAEVDFLKSLPTKMIFGLVTLFLSITTMMIAFSSAIYIMLDQKSGTGSPIILLGGIPVITFVLMQFRLLKDMVISTYGAGIFQKKAKPWHL